MKYPEAGFKVYFKKFLIKQETSSCCYFDLLISSDDFFGEEKFSWLPPNKQSGQGKNWTLQCDITKRILAAYGSDYKDAVLNLIINYLEHLQS